MRLLPLVTTLLLALIQERSMRTASAPHLHRMRTTRGLPIQDRGERQEFRAKTLLQLANTERIEQLNREKDRCVPKAL